MTMTHTSYRDDDGQCVTIMTITDDSSPAERRAARDARRPALQAEAAKILNCTWGPEDQGRYFRIWTNADGARQAVANLTFKENREMGRYHARLGLTDSEAFLIKY